jgi:hypothetical protein
LQEAAKARGEPMTREDADYAIDKALATGLLDSKRIFLTLSRVQHVRYVQLPQEFLAGHMLSGDAPLKEIVADRALTVLRRLCKRGTLIKHGRKPGEAAEELWIIAGRLSGKTRAIGTLAAYLAGCCDYRDCLGPGERRRVADHGGEYVAGGAVL